MSGATEQAARRSVAFRCPACGTALTPGPDGLRCGGCERAFDRPLGIPDLRLSYPDPQLSRDEDARLAHTLAVLSPERDFRALLYEHWWLVGKRPELAARFTGQETNARMKSEPIVDAIEAARGAPLGPGDRVLEVGCGTAALAAAMSRRGATTVASDASLRWLVLAQKRLADEPAAKSVDLVACAAEALPFPNESFDVVTASDVVEHVEGPERFVAECARVLRPGGLLFLATPNRYSLGLEPHVRLWGVGFLPRSLAEPYVRGLRKTSYSHVRLLSARALTRLLQRNDLTASIVLPPVPPATLGLYSGIELVLARAYNRVRSWPAAQPFLLAVGPFFHIFSRKTGEAAERPPAAGRG